ncbi:MAG: homocysteine S-methyltransferase family protein [Planctomycetes bacterium]|nr:homocysteine S-methyltransferase family protein [Planctomycetota bacterium]
MKSFIEKHNLILTEAAIVEQLRRAGGIKLHPNLEHAPLIYDDKGKKELQRLYQSYISIATQAELPFIMCTPTWRANYERVTESGFNRNINSDAAGFMKDLRDAQGPGATMIKIGGLVSCKNDCYKPEEGLSVSESEIFHCWQIDQLAEAGVDFLIAETLPNTEEAIGIAKAIEKTATPYIISFVINRSGCVLDGTSLWEAIQNIDGATRQQPLCYMVNCSYPTFLCAEKQPTNLFSRLIGYQANASSLNHCDLDESTQLETENVVDWGEEMLRLNRKYGMKILGGCCGTGVTHLRYLAEAKSG